MGSYKDAKDKRKRARLGNTYPTCPSLLVDPAAHARMNETLQELLPWIREDRTRAAALWCALSHVAWVHEGRLIWSATGRGVGAYVADLFYGPADPDDGRWYEKFYCSGPPRSIHPHIYEYMIARGWRPHSVHEKKFDAAGPELGSHVVYVPTVWDGSAWVPVKWIPE